MKLSGRILFALATLCAAIAVVRAPARAEEAYDPEVERKAQEVFSALMSPFCPGRALNDCPSDRAHKLKDEIRKDIAAGLSPRDVTEREIAKFGEQYRAAPKAAGVGLFAWLAPILFFGLGGCIIGLWLSARRTRAESLPSEASVIDPRAAEEIKKILDNQ